MNKTVGERIREQRKKADFTLEEVANRLGLQKSVVSKYERGEVETIKRSHFEKMAEMFDCSPLYLMGYTDQVNWMPGEEYFMDDYVRQLALFLRDNPEYKALLSSTMKVKPEDLETVASVIEKFADQ